MLAAHILLDMSAWHHGEVDCEGALRSDDERILIYFCALFAKWDPTSGICRARP